MSYLALKWLHILSSTILFGTGIGSAFYLFMANRRRELPGIGFALRHVVIADWIFTAPAALVQLASGIALVWLGGWSWRDDWIMGALTLYVLAGACWVPVVWIQICMRRMADAALLSGDALPARYWQMDRAWITLGCIAFTSLVVVFYLMVFKPV